MTSQQHGEHCARSLQPLCHALLDLGSPRAFWLLGRVAEFLERVGGGEWASYHPLRQRVHFRQLVADLDTTLNVELAGSVPQALVKASTTAAHAYLAILELPFAVHNSTPVRDRTLAA